MTRLWSSTVARLVAAIFLLQIVSGVAAIVLVRTQMLEVISADRTRQVLDVRDELLATYYASGSAGLARFVNEQRGSIADPLIFVAVVQPGAPGQPLLSHVDRVPPVAAGNRPVLAQVLPTGTDEPTEALAIASELSDGTRLITGAFTAPDHRFDLAFAEAITLTVVMTVALAFAGAVGMGVVVSRQTHAIAETAEALAAGDFAARVRSRSTGDGFDHLRQQMNLMAERIARLVSELQSVSGALAHDLRSPVARLKAAIELGQAAVPDGPAAEALALARSDADVLDDMLSAALELARVESGALEDRRVALDLSHIVDDLVELYEPLAEQSGVTLKSETTPVECLADRDLLSRALANLIDNALKYGGDRILVRTVAEREFAVLQVVDNGPGIPGADRPRALERFTRLDNARTHPGAGLGLTMVAAVAGLHGGKLELSSGEGRACGLIATVRLPRS